LATKRVGIIGYPIRHSASPAFQQAALDFKGIDAKFEAWAVEPGTVVEWMAEQDRTDLLGFGVTVPHKQEIMKVLDYVDNDAKAIGAVNTVVVGKDKRLLGYNTDAYGFLHALQEDGEFTPAGQHVLVLGAGGVSRAVCTVLLREGVASLTLANRTVARAEALLGDLATGGVQVEAISLEPDSLKQALATKNPMALIVNCTLLGMLHGPNEEASPIPGELIPSGSLVFDLVYNPAETPLMKLAEAAGAKTLGGLSMLVYQGTKGFQLWTGEAAPLEIMMAAAKKAVHQG
jgi:shikimate dehydrogenase